MRHALNFCRIADSVVVLDAVADKYRLLTGEGARRFIRKAEGRASPADAEWLFDQGIEGVPYDPLPEFIAPARSALDQGSLKASRALSLIAAFHQLRYAQRLRKQPLHRLLNRFSVNIQDNDRTEMESQKIAAAFDRSRRYLPAEDGCLPRALAMAHMLNGAGVGAQLIFGVTLPFSAHCWIQQGELVLSDQLDHVRPFRPIMILS